MQLTPEIKQWLIKQNRIFANKLGIAQPLLIFTDKELKRLEFKERDIQYFMIHDLGRSWKDRNLVFLNVDNTDFLWQILDTLVHELLHLKEPKLRHGLKFQKKVNDIIIGL